MKRDIVTARSRAAASIRRATAITTIALFASAGAARAAQPASDAQPSSDIQALIDANAKLTDEVHDLKTKVDTLEARGTSTTQPSVAEIVAAADAVRADANRRSLALSDSDTLLSGYDPTVGFVLRSDDGNFTFHPGLAIDIRHMDSYSEKIPPGGNGEVAKTGYVTQDGFDITRLRITADGHYTPRFTYYLQIADDQGQGFTLLDAYGTYRVGEDSPWYIRAGQWKDPVWHERTISEARLPEIDRPVVESLIGGGQTSRIQGAALLFDRGPLREQLVAHDGYNSINTKFFDAGGIAAGVGGGAGVTPTNYGFTSRTDYLVIGDRTSDYNPYTQYDNGISALGARQNILVVGLGADYSEAGANNVLFHTIDAQYDTTGGLSIYGAYLGSYRQLRANQGVTPGYYYDPGFQIQAGYLVTAKLEPYVRYDYTYLAGGSATLADHAVQEITVGANYYIHGQNLKLSVDGIWLPDGAPADIDALGILKDSGNNEFVLRAQLQLSI
jgi:hypothetical protein